VPQLPGLQPRSKLVHLPVVVSFSHTILLAVGVFIDSDSFERDGVGIRTQTLKQKAYHDLKEYLLVVLYLWLVFGLFILYKSLILNEEHISYLARGVALINALVLGKFILMARALHLGDTGKEAPLIYPTLLKSFLFSVVVASCKILEDAAVGFYHHKPFSDSIADLGGGTLKGILTLTLLLFVLLIPFFAVGELQRVLGEGKLAQLFFRRSNGESDQFWLGRNKGGRAEVGQTTKLPSKIA
jgi:hypothetical protein